MRKTISKEVNSTIVKVARMKMFNGIPEAVVLPDVIMLGNVSAEKAQKEVHKEFGKDVTVFTVESKKEVYEMSIEEFIKVASVKEVE